MRLLLTGSPCLQIDAGPAQPLAVLDGALAAWLAIEGPTARERLALLLWPDAGIESSRNNLRQRLFNLRKRFGDELIGGRTVVALGPRVAHDLDGADTLLGDIGLAVAGEFAAWLEQQRRSRREGHAARLDAACRAAEARGDYMAARAEAQLLLELDRLSEGAHRRVMRLAYASGDRAAALLAFDRCERILKDEIGAAPSAETLALLSAIDADRSGELVPVARREVAVRVLRPPRLIGREAQWRALEQAWQSCGIAMVLGEGGLGKTRLITDFAVGQQRCVVAGARPGDDRVVYSSLSRLLRAIPTATLAALAAPLVRELARLLPELGDAEPMTTPEQRGRFFNAIASALGEATCAVVFDDLHFADEASIDMLRHASSAARRPWIVSARGAELSAAGAAWLAAVDEEAAAVRIELAPLDVGAVAALIESLDIDGLDAAAAPALHARTGGNPMYILETLKAGHGSATALPSAGRVPVSVRTLIQRRIGHLSQAAVQLARCAAIATPDFDIELAARVLGLRTVDLADPWAELEAAQVLRDGAFAHDLIYESALASVPAPVARQLHAEIAGFLEESHGEPGRIAAHWIAAGREANALGALRQAAEAARRALRLQEEADIQLRIADIAEHSGAAGVAFEALDAWAHLARTADRTKIDAAFLDRLERAADTPERRVDALLTRAVKLREDADPAAALLIAERAAALALAAADEEGEAKALMYSAGCAGMLGDVDRSIRLLRRGLPWIMDKGSPMAQASFFNDLGCELDNAAQPAEAEGYHRRALALSQSLGRHDRAANAAANLAVNRRSTGRCGEALEILQQARRFALAADAAAGIFAPIDRGTVAALRDLARYDEALRASELLLQTMAQQPASQAAAQADIACLWLHLGQPARAHRVLEDAAALPALPFVQARLMQTKGLLRMASSTTEARPLLSQALESARRGGRARLTAIIELDLAATLPADEAHAAASRVLAWARERGLAGLALAACARASRFAADAGALDAAVALAFEALSPPDGVVPDDFYGGELWLHAAHAFDAAGRRADAADAIGAGADWVRRVARDHVPDGFRAGFLERNEVNRAMLAIAARR